MINIIKDVDLYEHVDEYDAVLIGTNTYCTMSQGIQLQVMLNELLSCSCTCTRRFF
jgi:hypothetical protein